MFEQSGFTMQIHADSVLSETLLPVIAEYNIQPKEQLKIAPVPFKWLRLLIWLFTAAH